MIAELELPTQLPGAHDLQVRRATARDVPRIVDLLAADAIALDRGDTTEDLAPYRTAFEAIAADPSNDVIVVESSGGIVGTLQLTRSPGMSRRGATRVTIESVRVDAGVRGRGVGSALLRWVCDVAAPRLDASIVQLTSDARRDDAIRLYARAGFEATHVGLKRILD